MSAVDREIAQAFAYARRFACKCGHERGMHPPATYKFGSPMTGACERCACKQYQPKKDANK